MIGKILYFFLSLSLSMSPFLFPRHVLADTITLQEGLSMIISKGHEMRVAVARESAVSRIEDQARARLRPTVKAYADQTWLRDRPEAIFGAGTSPLSEDEFLRYGLTVNQLITDFGRTGSGVEAASAATRGQVLETLHTRNTAALDFVTSYVSLLQAEKALTLTDLEVERFSSHVEDAKALYAAGEVTLNDVLVAEVALADASLRRLNIQDERNLAVSRINFLMLLPLDSATTVVNFPYQLDPVPAMEEVSARARENRPELKILAEKVNAKKAQLSSTQAESLPAVFVSGGYTYEENPYRVHEDNWSATVGLTWDLYTGGARTASKKQIMDELSALLIQQEQASERVALEVRDSHRLLTGAVEKAAVTKKAVSQAQESLRLQRSRYTEGEATATDVTDAVTSLARAENNHWTAVYERLKAEARLLYASGEDMASIYSNSREETSNETYNSVTGE